MYINYDLDNTIINIDSDFEFILYINKIKNNLKIFFKNIFFFKNYNNNKLNIKKYNKFNLKSTFFLKKNICKFIKIKLFFFKKIIKNKINTKTLFILNIIKINHKTIINTSTNKNITKIIFFFIKIKLSKQSDNKNENIKTNIIINNTNGLINYKTNKIKNKFLFKHIKTDSINDIIWFKKEIKPINPDKLLINIFISKKKHIIWKKKIKKLFY